jgi:hypothetical protein
MSQPTSDSATSLVEDWLTPLLMTISQTCCICLTSVLLSFNLENRLEIDDLSWSGVDHALSPACCPQLRVLRVRFFLCGFGISDWEVKQWLPGLISGGVVNISVSTSSEVEDWYR